MKTPKAQLARFLARFDELIAQGGEILNTARYVPAGLEEDEFGNFRATGGHTEIDRPKFFEWRIRSATLLAFFITGDHIHAKAVRELSEMPDSDTNVVRGISLLRALRDDLQSGFLDSLSSKIQAEIAADYMQQAEELLENAPRGNCVHVAAAVLAGAVLEQSLRTVAERRDSQAPAAPASGEHKTVDALIDDLEGAGLFNAFKSKQLRTWAALSALAIQGEFKQVTRKDAESMVREMGEFLADLL